jgi:hypothetical protein
MVYEIKCAWCGKSMGTKECEHTEFTLALETMGLPIISHAICPICSKKALEDANISHEGENHE